MEKLIGLLLLTCLCFPGPSLVLGEESESDMPTDKGAWREALLSKTRAKQGEIWKLKKDLAVAHAAAAACQKTWTRKCKSVASKIQHLEKMQKQFDAAKAQREAAKLMPVEETASESAASSSTVPTVTRKVTTHTNLRAGQAPTPATPAATAEKTENAPEPGPFDPGYVEPATEEDVDAGDAYGNEAGSESLKKAAGVTFSTASSSASSQPPTEPTTASDEGEIEAPAMLKEEEEVPQPVAEQPGGQNEDEGTQEEIEPVPEGETGTEEEPAALAASGTPSAAESEPEVRAEPESEAESEPDTEEVVLESDPWGQADARR